MYGKRLDESNHYGSIESLGRMRSFNLRNMCFAKFCSHFYVGKRGRRKNKMCLHRRSNSVPVFFPNKSFNQFADDFYVYCKLFLTKYRPWSDNLENAWNNLEEPVEIIKLFEST